MQQMPRVFQRSLIILNIKEILGGFLVNFKEIRSLYIHIHSISRSRVSQDSLLHKWHDFLLIWVFVSGHMAQL